VEVLDDADFDGNMKNSDRKINIDAHGPSADVNYYYSGYDDSPTLSNESGLSELSNEGEYFRNKLIY
jgi:hypothetical protein